MSDLTEFLMQRIAEDEEVTRAASPGPWAWEECDYPDSIDSADGSAVLITDNRVYPPDDETAAHIIAWNPARVLAECESKRRIVTASRDYSPELEHGDNGSWAFDEVLRLLALPYAAHPDYREEWRP